MNIGSKKLSAELLDDRLHFIYNIDFSYNEK